MSARTTHVIPENGGWAVKTEGSARHRANVYSTKREAMDVAREITNRSSAGQIVVHGRDGLIQSREVHGLPTVQTPPRKSDLGTKAIERAVLATIRERL